MNVAKPTEEEKKTVLSRSIVRLHAIGAVNQGLRI